MNEPQPHADPVAPVDRAVAAYALNSLALACLVASLTLVAMMLAQYLFTQQTDFRGRYLFAALPLLATAITLNARADKLQPPEGGPTAG
jgi:ABC-type glycerol-3-phosphate transport system permease component